MNESEGEKFDGVVRNFTPPNYSTRDYLIPQKLIITPFVRAT